MNFTRADILFNPVAIAIGEMTPVGVPRSQITSPVCPNTAITDDVLFEGAIDATQKFYLPRYRVSELNQQVQVSLAPNGQAWSLTIYLERYPAPVIQELARSAQVIDHSVSVVS